MLTGIIPKLFTKGLLGVTQITQMENLYYSTWGGVLVCLGTVIALGWLGRFRSQGKITIAGRPYAREILWLVPSGICTAVIIPTTTMMYTFGISVMVAMMIMRGSIILIGRAVDAIQIQQVILKKDVFWEENAAVAIACLAVVVILFFKPVEKGAFDFLGSPAALTTLVLYVTAYAVRIYIMNHYKNTQGSIGDNRAFFAIEQIVATVTLGIALVVVLVSSSTDTRIVEVQRGWHNPNVLAILGGVPFGLAAFPSVFLFMFKGRNAAFCTVVNRATSVLAGTVATLALVFVGQPAPGAHDWASFVILLVAIAFLVKAERRRARIPTIAP
ncbi:MAG: hypothetical protein HY984_01495 [Candidatus Magasanikbacteria bacterium]|nr:hypothetical protein [Candidatus Magasanikbacteria bacterium]